MHGRISKGITARMLLVSGSLALVLGAFFVLLLNVLNAARLSPFVIDAVKGVVILLAAFLDVARTRLASREN